MSTSGPSSSSTARPAKRGYRYEEDDEDLAPAAATKADWKSNPFVPLGTFGAAVALGVGIVVLRRNAGWNMSQTIMQARVVAQGACVAGLVGLGAYTTWHQRQEEANARK